MRATASAILGFAALPERVAEQIFLPGSLAGLSVKRCSETLLAAPVASAAQCLFHVVKWIAAQTTFPAEIIVNAFDSSSAQASLGLLAQKSLFFILC